MKQAMEKVDLMVDRRPVSDAPPSAMPDRKDGVYLLPAATQFETSGSVTASNRSIQWREKVIEPLFESKPDHTIMYAFAKKFGFGDEFVKNIKLVKDKNGWDEPVVEDMTARDQQRATGPSATPARRRSASRRTCATWRPSTRRRCAARSPRSTRRPGYDCNGDYFGLPWPCYGTADDQAPRLAGPLSHRPQDDGRRRLLPRQLRHRAKDGVSLLAEDGSHSEGFGHHHGLPGVRPRAA